MARRDQVVPPVIVDWAEVYRTAYSDLVRYLYRKVWDEERARDLAQEVFVRVLDDSPDNPRAWLFTAAANIARDEARTVLRRKRHLTLIKAEAEEAAPAADPIETIELEEKRAAARRALERLGDRDREVLILWDAGMNYEEIAQRTGLAVGAVGTTLSRARRRLVDAFDALEEKNVARG